MRKHIFGRQLQRDFNERKALFKGLMEALVINESIQTTEAKAKSIKGLIEKSITKAKKGGIDAERALQAYFALPILKKLMTEIAPRFATRPGGYTRIIKIGKRLRDDSKMVIIEFVEKKQAAIKAEVIEPKSKKAAETKEEKVAATKPVAKKEKPVKKTAKKEEKKK